MGKAIFLDRDGTIIEDRDYISKIEDVILLKNTVAGLRLLQDNGYLLFVISNQSGVARGYFSEDTVKQINDYLDKLLLNEGVNIEHFYYCPHHKNGVIDKYRIDCNCRKPKTGMIEQILDNYDIDLKNSFVIGDKLADIELGKNCNCSSILVLTGYGLEEQKKIINDSPVAADLLSAAKMILGKF